MSSTKLAPPLRWLAALALSGTLAACASTAETPGAGIEIGTYSGDDEGVSAQRRPERFTIVPDNYHVPYAGTAEDGRRFFLSEDLVDARLAELGDYTLEPIEVEPFVEKVDGVRFGWSVHRYQEDGTFWINIEPGDFIAYYDT